MQQEHFASALAEQRIHALIAASPSPSRPATILIGCPPKEEHVIPSLLMTFFLRRRGFNIIYLGANVPGEQFMETINKTQPQLVILSAQQLTTTATLVEMSELIADSQVPVAYSGSIFQNTPALKNSINAHFLGESFEESLKTVNTILQKGINKSFETKPVKFEKLSEAFNINRPAIHAHLTKKIATWDIPQKPLLDANDYLSDNIAAALSLGDLDFLFPELLWVKTLLTNRKIETKHLINYWRAYHDALIDTLGEEVSPLTDWLSEQISKIAQST